MITKYDKISLITDVDNLFDLNNPKVQDMINGDTFIINELYRKNLKIFEDNVHIYFRHLISGETMQLHDWINYYNCDINDPKTIIIFLRLAEPILG